MKRRAGGYTFAESERIIAKAIGVPVDAQRGLRSRMKYFLKLGFPPTQARPLGTRYGRGKARHFSERDLFDLFLATSLNYDGFPPEHVKRIIESRLDTVHREAEAGRSLLFSPESALSGSGGKARHSCLWWPLGAMREKLMIAVKEV
jgi:hypothetical protein